MAWELIKHGKSFFPGKLSSANNSNSASLDTIPNYGSTLMVNNILCTSSNTRTLSVKTLNKLLQENKDILAVVFSFLTAAELKTCLLVSKAFAANTIHYQPDWYKGQISTINQRKLDNWEHEHRLTFRSKHGLVMFISAIGALGCWTATFVGGFEVQIDRIAFLIAAIAFSLSFLFFPVLYGSLACDKSISYARLRSNQKKFPTIKETDLSLFQHVDKNVSDPSEPTQQLILPF